MNLQTQIDSQPDRVPELFGRDFIQSPYATYRWYREHAPVFRCAQFDHGAGMWMVTRYDDAVQTRQDEHFSADLSLSDVARARAREAELNHEETIPAIRILQDIDPPDHTVIRRAVNRALMPLLSEAALSPAIQSAIDELLARLEPAGEFDFASEFAAVLPIAVMGHLMDVPASDHRSIGRWSAALVPYFFSTGGLSITDDLAPAAPSAEMLSSLASLGQYLLDLIQDRRKHPREDLVSRLVLAADGDREFPSQELPSTLGQLLIAGHETTANMLSSGLFLLLREPAHLRRLREHPESIPPAIDEILRYESPIAATFRVALDDCDLRGTTIPKGALCFVPLAAANRDPAQFANPDVFDPGRTDNKHLAFGRGIHACVGRTLVHLEGRLAYEALLSRMRSIGLAVDPSELRFRNTISMRVLERLPVHYQLAGRNG